MQTRTVDRPLVELTDPTLMRPLPAALHQARSDIVAAATELLAIPEAALIRHWSWKGDSEEQVRYAAYRAAEAMELAELEARSLMAAGEATETRAARAIGPATAARWDLHGVLHPLDGALLDADPGSDQWPIRTVLGHTISSQRGYAWGSSWWQAQGFSIDDPQLPKRVPEEIGKALPKDRDEAQGSLAEVSRNLDAILDLSAERLAGLPDERSAYGARWAGFAVTVGFRFGRWSSHIREHTIQVEKTLAMVGHQQPEPARLVRNLLAAYGRAEATVFGRLNADAAAGRIAGGAAEARETIHSARSSAET